MTATMSIDRSSKLIKAINSIVKHQKHDFDKESVVFLKTFLDYANSVVKKITVATHRVLIAVDYGQFGRNSDLMAALDNAVAVDNSKIKMELVRSDGAEVLYIHLLTKTNESIAIALKSLIGMNYPSLVDKTFLDESINSFAVVSDDGLVTVKPITPHSTVEKDLWVLVHRRSCSGEVTFSAVFKSDMTDLVLSTESHMICVSKIVDLTPVNPLSDGNTGFAYKAVNDRINALLVEPGVVRPKDVDEHMRLSRLVRPNADYDPHVALDSLKDQDVDFLLGKFSRYTKAAFQGCKPFNGSISWKVYKRKVDVRVCNSDLTYEKLRGSETAFGRSVRILSTSGRYEDVHILSPTAAKLIWEDWDTVKKVNYVDSNKPKKVDNTLSKVSLVRTSCYGKHRDDTGYLPKSILDSLDESNEELVKYAIGATTSNMEFDEDVAIIRIYNREYMTKNKIGPMTSLASLSRFMEAFGSHIIVSSPAASTPKVLEQNSEEIRPWLTRKLRESFSLEYAPDVIYTFIANSDDKNIATFYPLLGASALHILFGIVFPESAMISWLPVVNEKELITIAKVLPNVNGVSSSDIGFIAPLAAGTTAMVRTRKYHGSMKIGYGNRFSKSLSNHIGATAAERCFGNIIKCLDVFGRQLLSAVHRNLPLKETLQKHLGEIADVIQITHTMESKYGNIYGD